MVKGLFAALVLLLADNFFLLAQGLPRQIQYNLENGLALKGYDPVTYFSADKPIRGDKQFAVADRGVTYYFSTEANKDEFKKNPSRYEPQYGGWCAYAMGKNGSKVEVDPATFKIIDGKLFLFYNQFFNHTLKSWNKDEDRLHRSADINWQKLIQ
jgi:YHS domain-containing protein